MERREESSAEATYTSLPTSAKTVPWPGAVKCPLLPFTVTVTVPSPFGWTIYGPASAVWTVFPFAGFV